MVKYKYIEKTHLYKNFSTIGNGKAFCKAGRYRNNPQIMIRKLLAEEMQEGTEYEKESTVICTGICNVNADTDNGIRGSSGR